MPTKGKKMESAGIDITRVKNGKIVENWDISDELGFADQLSYVMKPVEEKKK